MSLKRRDFIRLSSHKAALGASLLYGMPAFLSPDAEPKPGGPSDKIRPTGTLLDDLKPMTADVTPITLPERLARIERVQRLMVENKIQALLLDAGTAMVYFTGISWWPSERTMVAIIPAKGEIKYVSPAFEAQRPHELITLGSDLRTWEEHESPYKQIANAFKDLGIQSRPGSFLHEEGPRRPGKRRW